jgi:preprotein translocase subunit SecA
MREDDVVINVLAHRGLAKDDFFKNVTIRSRIEHYRSRPRATVTLGIDQRDSSKPFEIAQWVEGTWEHEATMEQLLAEDHEQPRIAQLPHGVPKPGRNDPCPCGSGKKFKRCCIANITFRRPEPPA